MFTHLEAANHTQIRDARATGELHKRGLRGGDLTLAKETQQLLYTTGFGQRLKCLRCVREHDSAPRRSEKDI